MCVKAKSNRKQQVKSNNTILNGGMKSRLNYETVMSQKKEDLFGNNNNLA